MLAIWLLAATACTGQAKQQGNGNGAMTDSSKNIAKRDFQRRSDAELRKMLTPELYAVTQQSATERPYRYLRGYHHGGAAFPLVR